jgi:hypothetical protein
MENAFKGPPTLAGFLIAAPCAMQFQAAAVAPIIYGAVLVTLATWLRW